MVIGPIQPGTFSPLTVSIPVLVSTFSTVPRNVCSFFSVVCAADFEDDCDREFEADDCPALRLSGEMKLSMAAHVRKTASLDLITMPGFIANSEVSKSHPALRTHLEFFPGADSAGLRDSRSEP